MKTITKLTLACICLTALTACAFTQDVIQNGYDNKVEEECRDTHSDMDKDPRCDDLGY